MSQLPAATVAFDALSLTACYNNVTVQPSSKLGVLGILCCMLHEPDSQTTLQTSAAIHMQVQPAQEHYLLHNHTEA